MKKLVIAGFLTAVAGAVAYAFIGPAPTLQTAGADARIAVETMPVKYGSLVEERRFPGSVEAAAEFTVAPKIAGRVTSVSVDIGDEVKRGQVVVTLDNDEYTQAVAQARAQLQVARAQLNEANSSRGLADRRLQRVRKLEAQGIAPASELDDAESEAASRAATVAVAQAQIEQARAALQTAQVRLGYTTVQANWPGDDETRLVGQRMVDAGNTVASNTALLSIVATGQLKVIVQVPQSVYAALLTGQRAQITTPALPDARFEGVVTRIAPRFDPSSRQARVELAVDNPQHLLAPGMFVQVAIESRRVDDASIVPATALVERSARNGIFKVDGGTGTARFVPAEVVLRSGEQVALKGIDAVPGDVVVLGQDQLTDGAAVVLPQGVGQESGQ